jgi:glycosyltransferase involved in cell wall biosynthesis
LKIAYLITRSDNIGGAQVHVRDLASAMRHRGHDAWVLTGGEGPFTEGLKVRGIPYVSLRHLAAPIVPWRDAKAVAEVRAVLKARRPDILSSHSSKAGVLGRVAARSLGIPSVFTAHGWSFTPGVPRLSAAFYRWSERLAAPLASRIITVSHFDRELAVRQRVSGPERLVTIHNGMPDITPDLRASPETTPVRLAMIARFEPQKDHETLFRALASLQDLEWSIDLVGDGPKLAQARRNASALGLEHRIRFLGAVEYVPPILTQSHTFLLISNWEGFPRSILEAMRAGLPVVASDVGGVSEAVEHGVSGFLAPRGDAEAVGLALRSLIQDPELRRRQGARSRWLYETRFNLSETLARTIDVYESVVANGTPSAPQAVQAHQAGNAYGDARRPRMSPPSHRDP